MKYKEGYHQINIIELSLDPNNPRHDPVNDDKLALEALMKIKNYDNKIIVLMKDILEYGQNPIDIIGVLITENNTLYSKEGNRRVSAFKIMNNPDLIKESNAKLYKRVINLLKRYEVPSPEVMCYVTRNQSTLDHAVELKHQGEQNGAGTVSWGSKEKARHRRNKGIHDSIHAFLNFLEDERILSAEKRNHITKTNWERLFTKDGQEWLGILKKGNIFEIVGDNDAFNMKFRLITDVIENESHYIITNFKVRKTLFEKLDEQIIKLTESSFEANKSEQENSQSDNEEEEKTFETITDNTKNHENDNKNKKNDKSNEDKSSGNSQYEKPIPSKFKLHELYIIEGSKIPEDQHIAFFNIHRELNKLAGGNLGFYRTYKLSTFYLIRALIEQCLKYWLSVYHKTLYEQCISNNDANLGKMISKINKRLENGNDIFFNRTINVRFQTFFVGQATKDFLDTLIHHPYLLSDDINILHKFTSGALFEILNHILTYTDTD